LTGTADLVLKVQFADNGRRVVVGFARDRAVVWDAADGQTLATVEDLNAPGLVTADGQRIVCLEFGFKWWDVRLGRELLYLRMAGAALREPAMRADGRRLAALSGNKVILWEAGPP
jgi:hypothetical protein